MNCQDINSFLNDAARAAPNPKGRAAIDVHLADCADCRDEWLMHELLGEVPVPNAPPHLFTRVRTMLELQAAGVLKPFRYRRTVVTGALLTVGLAAAASYYAVSNDLFRSEAPTADPEAAFVAAPVRGVAGGVPLDASTDAAGATDTAPGPDSAPAPGSAPARSDTAGEPVASPRSASAQPEPVAAAVPPASAAAATTMPVDPVTVLVYLPELRTADPAAARIAGEARERLERGLAGRADIAIADSAQILEQQAAGLSSAEIGQALDADFVVHVLAHDPDGLPLLDVYAVETATGRLLTPSAGGPDVRYWLQLARRANAVSIFDVTDPATGEDLLTQQLRDLREAMFAADTAGAKFIDPPDRLAHARDSGTGTGERLGAIRELQAHPNYPHLPGVTLYPAELTSIAIGIATSADSPALRIDAWELVAAADIGSFIPQLLAALDDEPDAEVRAQIVRVLTPHYAERSVRLQLEQIAQYDPDPRVRQSAEYAGAGHEPARQEL